jgi:hypothetical protein
LRTIDHQVPKGLQIHMILDNYGTHTHDNVVAWLDKHPRFHLHFIPTSSSWLNMVERWFRELTEKAIRRGVFKSVPDPGEVQWRRGMAWAFEQAVGLVWYYEVSNPLVSLWGAARWIAYFMTRLGSRQCTFRPA